MKIKPLDPTVISSCEEFNLDSTTVALSGGEDYELLFTVKQEDFPKIKNQVFSIIGHVLPQSVVYISYSRWSANCYQGNGVEQF
jgi:thiamine monophosphate kinase